MLNIMEQFPLAQIGHNSADALHIMIEAKKLAYADLRRYVGDPKFSQIPVAGLLSPDYARDRAKLIDMRHANCDVGPGVPHRRRHNLSHRRGRRRQHGLPHPEQLPGVRLRPRRPRHRLRPAGSRGALQPRARLSRRPRRPQAPAPHHHSRIHDRRRHAHRLRHHGRLTTRPRLTPSLSPTSSTTV